MAELIFYQLSYDANRKPHGLIIRPAKFVDAFVLGTSAMSITIPSGAKFAMFSCTGNFYVNFANNASIPAVNVTDGSASELNPTVRDIEYYSSFSAIAPTECVLTISYYK